MACRRFGSLYYYLPDFQRSHGVTLLAFNDIRAAVSAYTLLPDSLKGFNESANAVQTVFYSAMLYSSSSSRAVGSRGVTPRVGMTPSTSSANLSAVASQAIVSVGKES